MGASTKCSTLHFKSDSLAVLEAMLLAKVVGLKRSSISPLPQTGPGRPPGSRAALLARAAEYKLCAVAHSLSKFTVGRWLPENELSLKILCMAVRDLSDQGKIGRDSRAWFRSGQFAFASWAAGLDPEYVLRILSSVELLSKADSHLSIRPSFRRRPYLYALSVRDPFNSRVRKV